jgi:hypothetical protein
MSKLTELQEKHTAGPQVAGFDYQFFYFMLIALELKPGEKVGFEVKEDVHIEKQDGTTVLFQTKHTIATGTDGTANLTTLDSDLWKTLSNWADMIKADAVILTTYWFKLVTNKSEGTNKFIDLLSELKHNDKADILERLREINASTVDTTLKKYIKNVLSLGIRKIKIFFSKLSIETNVDDVIITIKRKIFERTYNSDIVDTIFESLSSNMGIAKYTDIRDRKKFEITFEEFVKKFGKCFTPAFEKKPLPARRFPIHLPDNIEEQLFIKQLIDIGELPSGSKDAIDYTSQMLQSLQYISYLSEDNIMLPTDIEDFQEESILRWRNHFKEKYREIKKKLSAGASADELNDEIKTLAISLVDFIRRENLTIDGRALGIGLSNGHYYALSNTPMIGWHLDWENKYKIQ